MLRLLDDAVASRRHYGLRSGYADTSRRTKSKFPEFVDSDGRSSRRAERKCCFFYFQTLRSGDEDKKVWKIQTRHIP